jgi:hypothetical protein
MRLTSSAILITFLAAACTPPTDAAPEAFGPATPETETSVSTLSVAQWQAIGGIVSSSSPALESANGVLTMIAVSTSGSLLAATTPSLSSGWSPWQDLGHPGSTLFASDTAPVLLADGTTLYAFARGTDGNLYRASKAATSAWSSWTALTTHGRVHGRISVGFTRRLVYYLKTVIASVQVTHVVFTGLWGAVEYHRLEGTSLIASSAFQNVSDGVVGTDSNSEAWIAIRGNAQITVYRAVYQNSAWTFAQIGQRGATYRTYDVSNLAYFAGAFHMIYSVKQVFLPDYNIGYRTYHARFIPNRTDDGFTRFVTSFVPSQDPDAAGDTSVGYLYPQATLEVYRNKLIAAYRAETGLVRYARWDNTDPSGPWVGNANVSTLYTDRRPALAAFDGTAGFSSTDYNTSNYGNDLFAAGIGYYNGSLYSADYSRAITKYEVGLQFTLWSSADGSCGSPTPSLSISAEDRPFLTELGVGLWILPNWLDHQIYRDQAAYYCATEPYRTNWIGSGRVSDPCSSAKMPAIVKPSGTPFFCRGIWFPPTASYLRVFEEQGHYFAQALGLNDDMTGPTSLNETRSGIALSELQKAYSIFTENIGTCEMTSSAGRCTGFVNAGGYNYDSGSREHSFIYALYDYYSNGATLRVWVQDDLANGSTLLQRKYDWIRDNIYQGIEFDKDGAPINPL